LRVAYYALHYGKEYLAWSIRSVQDAVDKIIVVYSPQPSFGFEKQIPNPDTEEELREQAHRFANKPIIWHSGTWASECQHRDAGLGLAREAGAQTVLVVDSDEVWDPETAVRCMERIEAANKAGRWMARFANFFRTWKYMVHDQFTPIRIVDLRHPLNVDAYLEPQEHPIYHFGYAQSDAIMHYKWTIHGHQAELRNGWLSRFLAWSPGDEDLHPCVNNLWPRAEPTPAAIMLKLQQMMGDHPYDNLDVIR
jgi:hypothetical protein